jgi:hypothetical protein
VVELPPWGEFQKGRTVVTCVPANLAHGITEQTTFLVESPSFTLYDAVDAMEDPAVHARLGRHHDIDVAFLPVTGRSFLQGTPFAYQHTMDVHGAVRVAYWLDARCVVPFLDELDSVDRRPQLKNLFPECRLMEPGEVWIPGLANSSRRRSARPEVKSLGASGSLDGRSGLLKVNDAIGSRFETELFSLFLYGLVRMQRPEVVVELGTGLGVSSLWMAQGVKENCLGHVWTVDHGNVYRQFGLPSRFLTALRGAGFAAYPKGSLKDHMDYLAKELQLSPWLTLVERVVRLEEDRHFESYPFAERPIDLLFSDFDHAPDAVLKLLAHFLPRMAPASSILIHSAPTLWPTYLLLEKVVGQLNDGRVPRSISCPGIRDLVRDRRFTLVHLTEPHKADQNGAAWLKIEPVDVVPHPLALMRR